MINLLKSKEFKIGLMTIVAGFLGYNGVIFLKGTDFLASNNTYVLVLPKVNGLTESNPVTVSGMVVGQITGMKLSENGNNHVVISIDVDKRIPVGDSTMAVLTSTDLLGTKTIELKMGRNNRIFESGDTVRGEIETALTDAISSSVAPVISKIDTTASLVNGVLRKFDGTQAEINLTLASFRKTSETFNGVISDNKNELAQITKNISKLSAQLLETEKAARKVMAKMDRLGDTLNKAKIASMVENTNKVMANLNQTLTAMNKGEGTLGKLAKNDSLYRNLNQSSENLSKLLKDFNERPKRYVHFSVFGKKDK